MARRAITSPPFRDAIIAHPYLNKNPNFAMEIQPNTIHLPYKHDPSHINGIHECFLFCISKIARWDLFGIAIIKNGFYFAIAICLIQGLLPEIPISIPDYPHSLIARLKPTNTIHDQLKTIYSSKSTHLLSKLP